MLFLKTKPLFYVSDSTTCMICSVSLIDLVFIYIIPGGKCGSSSTGQGSGSEHQTSHGYSQGGLDDIKTYIQCDHNVKFSFIHTFTCEPNFVHLYNNIHTAS